MEKKIEFLDRTHTSKIKGAAIMLVLISHLAVYLFLDILGKGGIARLATPLGGIGASLFLFVSGYGIAQSAKGGLSGFWKKRFFGVILPYLLVWLALIPTSISAYTDIWGFAFDFLAISPRAEYFWYIGYQMFWYVVFYFTAKLGVPRWARLAIIFGIGTLCFFVLPNIYAEKAFSFAIGVLFAEAPRISGVLNRWWMMIPTFAVGAFALAIKQTAFIRSLSPIPYSFVELIMKLGFTLFFICAVYYAAMLIPSIIPKLFTRLSYEIYLAHSAGAVFFYLVLPINKLVGAVEFILATVIFTVLLWLFGRFVTPKLQGVKK